MVTNSSEMDRLSNERDLRAYGVVGCAQEVVNLYEAYRSVGCHYTIEQAVESLKVQLAKYDKADADLAKVLKVNNTEVA